MPENEKQKPKTPQQRILDGDETALPEFREWLRQNPAILDSYARKPVRILLERIASMTKEIAAGGPLLYREVLTATMKNLRSCMGGPAPSELEKLLVERIVATWLQVYDADLQAVLRGECSPAQAAFDVRRQNSAHRRFLSACKTLATVRKLVLPLKIDLNVGVVETKSADQGIPLERFQLPAKN